MTQLTAMVIIDSGATKDIHSMDVIEFDGQKWLVPEWIDFPKEKVTMPARMVLLDVIPHNYSESSPQVVVDGPVPKSVFEGRVPPELAYQYVVIERPNIQLPIPGATH